MPIKLFVLSLIFGGMISFNLQAFTVTTCKGICQYRTWEEMGGKKKAKWNAIKSGDSFAKELNVKTGAGSEMEIEMENGNTVAVKPDSKMVVQPASASKTKKSSVFLFVGRLIAKVKKANKGKNGVDVHGPTVSMGIRGTTLEMSAGVDGSYQAIASNGLVEFQDDYYNRGRMNHNQSISGIVGNREMMRATVEGDERKWDQFFAKAKKNAVQNGPSLIKSAKALIESTTNIMQHLRKSNIDLNKEVEALNKQAKDFYNQGNKDKFKELSKQGYKLSVESHQRFRELHYLKIKAEAGVTLLHNLIREQKGNIYKENQWLRGKFHSFPDLLNMLN